VRGGCGKSRIILSTCHTLKNAKKGLLKSLKLVFANEVMRAREQKMFKVAAEALIGCKEQFDWMQSAVLFAI
jgi:hypothetical protein